MLKNLKTKERIGFLISGIGAGQFILFTLIAMAVYPGGYSFFELNMSDLGLTVSIVNLVPNHASRIIYIITSIGFGIGIFIYWFLISKFFIETRIMKISCWISSACGWLSGIFLIGISLTPFNIAEIYEIHGFVARSFFTCSALMLISFSCAIILNDRYRNGNIFLNLLFSVFIFFYVFDLFPRYILLADKMVYLYPAIQKVIAYGLCVWYFLQLYQILNLGEQ